MTPPEYLCKYRITGMLGQAEMGVIYRGCEPDIRELARIALPARSLLSREVAGPDLAGKLMDLLASRGLPAATALASQFGPAATIRI